MAGVSTDHARVCLAHPHWPQPRCHAVDQIRPRRWKRGGQTWGDDLFVPKQLGLARVRLAALLPVSTTLSPRGRSASQSHAPHRSEGFAPSSLAFWDHEISVFDRRKHMDPISAGLLVAIATGAAGEAGKQLWEGLTGLVRSRPGDAPTQPDAISSNHGESELALFAESSNDLDRARVLSESLTRRAERDEPFRAGLMQWHQQAQALRTGDGETNNTISGGSQNGPVLQGRDFSGINFNGSSQN